MQGDRPNDPRNMIPDLQNKVKAEVTVKLYEARGTEAASNILKLMDILIDEARKEFDNANRLKFLRLQGKIHAYQELKASIERGIPGV